MSDEQSAAANEAQKAQWASMFGVSMLRMKSLVEAFGADEQAIEDVLRLSGNYRGRGNAGAVQSMER